MERDSPAIIKKTSPGKKSLRINTMPNVMDRAKITKLVNATNDRKADTIVLDVWQGKMHQCMWQMPNDPLL
jgi:hypothetical protein